jgi:hypothetical protein
VGTPPDTGTFESLKGAVTGSVTEVAVEDVSGVVDGDITIGAGCVAVDLP